MDKRLLLCLAVLCTATVSFGAWDLVAWNVDGFDPNYGFSEITDPCEGLLVSGVGGDIWGGAESAVYVYDTATVPGNFEAEALIVDFISQDGGNSGEWARAGLMCRSSLDDNSANSFVGVNMRGYPGSLNARRFLHSTRGDTGAGTGDNRQNNFSLPIYVKLVRIGNNFSSYYKYNEDDPWTYFATRGANVAADAYLGFCVQNHNQNKGRPPYDATFCAIKITDLAEIVVSDLTALPVPTGVQLTWSVTGDVDHYVITRTDASGEQTLVSDLAGTETSYTDTTAIDGDSATYVVTPYDPTDLAGPGVPVTYWKGLITDQGFVTTWLISPHLGQTGGWIPSDDDKLRDYLVNAEETVTEANILPAAGTEFTPDFGGKAASTGCVAGPCEPPTFMLHQSGDGWINYNAIYGDINDVMTYSVCYLTNTTDSPLFLYVNFNSDDSSVVYIDDTPVNIYSGCCGGAFWMWLPPGEHRCMVKVFEGGGGHNWRMRIRDGLTYDPLPIGTVTCAIETELTAVPEYPYAPAPGMNIAGFITDWLTLAHYNQGGGCGGGGAEAMLQDFLNEGGNGDKTEANIVPVDGMTVATDYTVAASTGCTACGNIGGTCDPLTVKAVQSASGYIDWNGVCGDYDNVMSYMFCYLTNTTDDILLCRMGAGSDDSIAVLIDNVPWHVNSVCRGHGLWQDEVPVGITPGTHRVVVKTFEGGGGHGSSLGFRDYVTGLPYLNGELEVSLTPPDGFVVPPPATVSTTRSLSACHLPEGGVLTVTINVDPADAVVDMFEVLLPPWGAPSNISDGGVYDAGIISWDDVSDGEVSYEIAMVAGAPEILGGFLDPAAGLVKTQGPSGVTLSEDLGDGWYAADIGGPGIAGTHDLADIGNGNAEVAGSGGDIWGTWDQFHFAWKEFTAENFYIQAAVTEFPVEGTDCGSDWGKAGVMLRDTCQANSAYSFAMLRTGPGCATPGYDHQARGATGAGAYQAGGLVEPVTLPFYVRLIKQGDQVTAYVSQDGAVYTAHATMTLPDEDGGGFLAGLAVTSHNNGALTGARFSSVEMGELPGCVTDFAATPSDGDVQLSWTNQGAYTHFVLERRALLATEWELVNDNIPGDQESFTDSPGKFTAPALHYRLSAYALDGTVLTCQVTAGVMNPDYLVLQDGVFPTPDYAGTADAHIITWRKDNNTGGRDTMEEGDWNGGHGDHKEIVLRFDLSGFPEDKIAESASLHLYYAFQRRGGAFEPVDHDAYVRSILKDWNEGVGASSPDGDPAQDGDVTWNSARHNEEVWEVAGAYGESDIQVPDPADEVMSTAPYGANPGQWVTFEGNALAAWINAWVTGEAPNYGLKVTQNPGHDPAYDYVAGAYNFASRNNGDPSVRPVLVIKLAPAGTLVFVGDANSSGAMDIADAVYALTYLFGPPDDPAKNPPCLANLDANDSDSVDISDPIKMLDHLFNQKPMIGPNGVDIEPGNAGCKLYPITDVVLPCDEECTP